jgi:hypothetical protein
MKQIGEYNGRKVYIDDETDEVIDIFINPNDFHFLATKMDLTVTRWAKIFASLQKEAFGPTYNFKFHCGSPNFTEFGKEQLNRFVVTRIDNVL